MGHGLHKIYASTMAASSTTSSEVNLGRSYQNVYLMIPTMASTTNGLSIYASDASGGSFYQVLQPSINSATVTTNPYVINSAASQVMVPIPAGFQFIKVVAAAAPAVATTFKIICGD